MQTTENLGLRKPEQNDFFNVDDFNHNADVVDALFEKDENGSPVVKNADAKTLDGHGADYFFPKSGGTVNGTVAVKGILAVGDTTQESKYQSLLRNAKRSLSSEIDAKGNYALWDSTHSAYIINSKADGTNTFNGTLTTKPTGTYTGNGDATERTISTGGIGSVCVIWANSYFAIVTPICAIYAKYNTADSVKSVVQSECKFSNGILTIASTNVAFNESGRSYTYQVL